jgi:hypothetical protein
LYNENPIEKQTGDCTVRAISTILGQSWEETYIELCLQGFIMADMPSSNAVWGAYLHSKGFRRGIFTDICPSCYTVRDFCEEHPRGEYILAISGHVVPVIDGEYFDTWDSGDELPIYYWEKER